MRRRIERWLARLGGSVVDYVSDADRFLMGETVAICFGWLITHSIIKVSIALDITLWVG